MIYIVEFYLLSGYETPVQNLNMCLNITMP